MKTMILIALALVATACTNATFVADPGPSTGPELVDWNGDGTATTWYAPRFTAEVVQNSIGRHIASYAADQRSPERNGTGVVTLNGTEVCRAELVPSVGTCWLPADAVGFVTVTVEWRLGPDLLWTGWIAP